MDIRGTPFSCSQGPWKDSAGPAQAQICVGWRSADTAFSAHRCLVPGTALGVGVESSGFKTLVRSAAFGLLSQAVSGLESLGLPCWGGSPGLPGCRVPALE